MKYDARSLEAAARIAESHTPPERTRPVDHEALEIIRAEENGERIAATIIAQNIRALAKKEVLAKNENIGLPVHNTNPVRYDPENDDWGWWDETWTEWTGGFATEAVANQNLKSYLQGL